MWSDLPSDLLFLIFNSETLSVIDFASVSSACSSWRLAAAAFIYPLQFRHQSPFLMFVGKEEPSSAQLYSFANNKIYTIPNQPDPLIATRIFIGSAHGWLITADEKSDLSLLNPITRQQIELPPVTTFEHVHCLDGVSNKNFTGYKYGLCPVEYDNSYIKPYTAQNLRYALYNKATISSSPASGDYVVALLLGNSDRLAFARAGDKKWTTRRKNINNRNDIIFLNGMLYTTTSSGDVEAWDFNQNDLSLIEPKLVFKKPWKERQIISLFNLVLAPWGEILLVERHRRRRNNDYGFRYYGCNWVTTSIEIWKIESGTDEKLVKLKSLGDYTLFLGGNISTCVSSKDNPELRGNSVYLIDDYGFRYYVCIFSLEDGSIELVQPIHSMVGWPTPELIMPSLA